MKSVRVPLFVTDTVQTKGRWAGQLVNGVHIYNMDFIRSDTSPLSTSAVRAYTGNTIRSLEDIHISRMLVQFVGRECRVLSIIYRTSPSLRASVISALKTSKLLREWEARMAWNPKIYTDQSAVENVLGKFVNVRQTEDDDALDDQRLDRRVSRGGLDLTCMDVESLMPEFDLLDGKYTTELDDNLLETLPDTFGYGNFGGVLSLVANRLVKLPLTFTRLDAVTNLHLDRNRLTELPASLGDMKSLKEFTMRENELHELPSSILQLANLEVLDVRLNNLREFPVSETHTLSSLTDVDLSYNAFMWLPDNWSGLVTFDVSHNSMSEIPPTVFNTKYMKECNISFNRLRSMPSVTYANVEIAKLYMHKNLIECLPPLFLGVTPTIVLVMDSHAVEDLPDEFTSRVGEVLFMPGQMELYIPD